MNAILPFEFACDDKGLAQVGTGNFSNPKNQIPDNATVTIGTEARELRNRELRLLEILIAAPDRIHSKAQLCDRLFSASEAVSDNAIEVYVGRLRRKIEGSRARIETLRGVGYRLIAT